MTPALGVQSTESRRLRNVDRTLGTGIYTLNLLIHFVLLAFPPAAFFYNPDERTLTFASLDRFLGVPPTFLSWPCSVIHLLSVPLFFLDFIVRRGIPRGQSRFFESFSSYLADAYADPRHQVIILRAAIAVVACMGPTLMFLVCRKLGAPRLVSGLCALALLLHPAFFGQSLMVAGDSAGLTAVLGAILVLLQGHNDRWQVIGGAGVLQAMAVALKLTNATTILIPIAVFCFYPAPQPRRGIRFLQFSAGFAGGLMLWCPYMWTEPLRFAKSVLGNVNKPGSSPDALQFFLKLKESAGTAFIAFAAVFLAGSLWSLRRSRARGLMGALLFSGAIIGLPLYLKATSAYARYFIPLALVPLLGFALIASGIGRQAYRMASNAAMGLLVVIMAASLVQGQIAIHAPDDLVNALGVASNLPPGAKIYLPEDAAETYALRLPQSTYARISARANKELESRQGITALLRGHHIPEVAIGILVNDFNENEQANASHAAAAAESGFVSNHAVFLYSIENSSGADVVSERTSWADADLAQAIESFRGEEPAALLIGSEAAPSGLGIPLWRGRKWNWYINKSASAH